MPEPSISGRCSFCGATIRARAAFCPQCGKENSNKATNTDTESSIRNVPGGGGWPSDDSATAHPNPELGSRDAELEPSSPPVEAVEAVGSRATIHRATLAAREAIEDNVLSPVKKLRRVSSVVLEEAAYDPSLRFVLVAAGLFVLFLVLLILSKWIG